MKNAVITIEGRVFKDATTVGQNKVTKFTVGVYNGKNKETGKSQSEFFDVVDWNGVHGFAPKDRDWVRVTGELTTNEYKSKTGETRKGLGVTPTKIERIPDPFDKSASNPANDEADF